MNTVIVALTKGRIEKSVLPLLSKAGFDMSDFNNKKRKLIFNDNVHKIKFVLAKANDVLTYVDYGTADIGIVGKDTLLEQGRKFYEVLDLKTGICKFVVAGMPGVNLYEGYRKKVIASKYPSVAAAFFRQKGIDVQIIKIDGSVEIAPILGLSDAIVDIVETGETLKQNGLIVYEDICPVSTRVIVNKACLKTKREVGFVIDKIQACIKKGN